MQAVVVKSPPGQAVFQPQPHLKNGLLESPLSQPTSFLTLGWAVRCRGLEEHTPDSGSWLTGWATWNQFPPLSEPHFPGCKNRAEAPTAGLLGGFYGTS